MLCRGRSHTRDHRFSASPICIAPVKRCPHVWHVTHTASPRCFCCHTALLTRQSMCARPLSPRHAQPHWIAGGSNSRQMVHVADASVPAIEESKSCRLPLFFVGRFGAVLAMIERTPKPAYMACDRPGHARCGGGRVIGCGAACHMKTQSRGHPPKTRGTPALTAPRSRGKPFRRPMCVCVQRGRREFDAWGRHRASVAESRHESRIATFGWGD